MCIVAYIREFWLQDFRESPLATIYAYTLEPLLPKHSTDKDRHRMLRWSCNHVTPETWPLE